MDTCTVTFAELLDYHEGRASDPVRLEAHLRAGCSRCAESLRWIQQFLPALSAALTETAPVPSPAAQAFARGLAQGRVDAPSRGTAAWVFARLTFDSRGSGVAATRHTGGEAFQRIYETEACVIHLWEEPLEEAAYLIGQAYAQDGAALAPAAASAVPPAGEPRRADLQGQEFHFAGLPRGQYELRLLLDVGEIRLVDVQVGG